VWRIEPDGSFESIADHSNCEGVVYGDIGTGPNVFAGSWVNPDIVAFNEDEERSVVFRGAPSRTVGLALPYPHDPSQVAETPPESASSHCIRAVAG
jgi:hypothetical protein